MEEKNEWEEVSNIIQGAIKREFKRNLIFTDNLVYEIKKYFDKYEGKIDKDLINRLESINNQLDYIRSEIS